MAKKTWDPDWEGLARDLGLLTSGGESGGSSAAKEAIVRIIGEQRLRDAVDFYVGRQPGSELVRSVLFVLRPWCAMERCYEIFKSGDQTERVTAVELLRMTADARVLPWVAEFLADGSEGVQNWGIDVLDQLVYCDFIGRKEAEPILRLALQHSSAWVREQASQIAAVADEKEHGPG